MSQIDSIFEPCVLSVFRMCSGGVKFVLRAHFTLCSVQFAATPALRADAGAPRPRGALCAPARAFLYAIYLGLTVKGTHFDTVVPDSSNPLKSSQIAF